MCSSDLEEEELNEPVTEWVPRPTTPIFGWRKGLAAFKDSLQAFRSRSKSPEKNEHAERDVAEVRTAHIFIYKLLVPTDRRSKRRPPITRVNCLSKMRSYESPGMKSFVDVLPHVKARSGFSRVVSSSSLRSVLHRGHWWGRRS